MLPSRKLLLLIIFSNLFTNLFAQFPDYHFRYFSVTDGLSNSEVYSINQDQQGFIWLGTTNGINRFDGINFKVYQHIPFANNQLIRGDYRYITFDKNGLMWIASSTNGAANFNLKTNKFQSFIYQEKDNSTIGDVASYKIIESKNGNIWFAHYFNGASFYNPTTKKFTRIRKENSGLNDNHTENIYERKNGEILIATQSGGINRYNQNSKKWQYLTTENSKIPTNFINGVIEDDDNNLWIATTKGIAFYDELKNYWQVFNSSNSPELKTDIFYNVTKNKDGLMFFNSDFGLYVIDPKTKKIKSYYFSENEKGYGKNSTTNLFFDKDNNLWIQFENGFCFASANQTPISYVSQLDASIKNKKGFYDYLKNDTIWAVVKNGIVAKKTTSITSKFSKFPDHLSCINSTRFEFCESNSSLINAIISFENRGIIYYNKVNERFEKLPQLPNGKEFGCDKRFDGYIDSKNNFWGLDKNLGVVKFNYLQKKWELLHPFQIEIKSQYYYYCTKFFEDKKGNMWILNPFYTLLKYNNKGICNRYIHNSKNKFSIGFEIPQSIFQDSKNRIWLGGLGRSLDLYDEQADQFIHFDKANVFDDALYNLCEDSASNMWCFAQHKLIKFTVSKVNYSNAFNNNFEYVIYSQLNGFKGFYFGNNFVFHTANNHLLFDSKAGFCDLDISKLSKKDIQPKVYFTSLKVNDNLVDTVFENDSVVALNFTKKINLNYNENSIQLSFAALSYQYSENNSYAYQLVGIDHDWKYCTAKNATAIYNLLPPGKYTFELKASNSNGIWTKQPKKLIIEIAPAFWQTWIFKAVVIGLIFAIIYLIYNYRLNQILKLHQIRNRIARDLHDDIGATMSAVNITSKMLERKLDDKIESKKLLENIQEDVKYVSESLDDIVWSINPENHEWSTLLSRMRRYASDIFENNSIQYEINFPEKISHEKLQVDVVKDFYLIFKEAVNNVAKHSQANYVKINLSIKNKIKLEIKDNGIGFDSKLPSDRNGLTNMKTRAKLINADFEITSEINLGTTIILIV